MPGGQRAERTGQPGKVVGVEHQIGQRVAQMRVETGGNQDQLRAESVDQRQHLVFPHIAKAQTVAAGRQQQVVDIADAAFMHAARVRVQARLVGTEVLHGGVAFKDRLGPIAMMDIEIHHRNALQPMPVAGVRGGHGDVVEQAKPIETWPVA